MPFKEIAQKILSSRPDLTHEEIFRMIEEKERAAKGFLTRESAARLVAAELGVELSKVSFKRGISIQDLISGLNNVTIAGRVILVYPLQKFSRSDGTEGKVRRLFVADKTGEIEVVLWDDKADMPNLEDLAGRIVRFSHGYVRRGFDGRLELHIGSRGKIEVTPTNVSEDEFPPLTNFMKKVSEVTGKEGTVSVLGAVGQVYPASVFEREDGTEGKVKRLELKADGCRITVVLWNRKVDELAEIRPGKILGIVGAKIRRLDDERFELHVDKSASTTVLDEEPPGFEGLSTRFVKIKDLKPKMRDVGLLGRVVQKSKMREFSTRQGKKGYISTLLIGDETGSIELNLWDDKALLSQQIKIGDIILTEKAYTGQRFGRLSLNLDDESLLTLNPSLAEVKSLPQYKEKIVKISDLKNENEIVTVEGTVATLPVIREVTTSNNKKVKLASFELADETGKIDVSLWRETAAFAENLSVNDQIRIRHVYVNRDFSGRLRLSSSSFTSLSKM